MTIAEFCVRCENLSHRYTKVRIINLSKAIIEWDSVIGDIPLGLLQKKVCSFVIKEWSQTRELVTNILIYTVEESYGEQVSKLYL